MQPEGLPALLTSGLTKSFGSLVALNNLDLQIEQGEIFGFLGPNGAGKSTTIRLLLDLIRPTAGSATVLGFDCQRESREVRGRVGYLAGDLRLYPGLTGQETVELVASLRTTPVDRAYVRKLAASLDLDLAKHAGSYSKGNRQKLGVVLALLARPPLLLLDEPTSGLDPIVQHTTWDLLREEASRGTTVFFSSHVMSEVEQVCGRVGILRGGKLVAVEPVAALKERALRRVEVSFAGAAPENGTFTMPGVREIERHATTIHLEVSGDIDPLIKALAGYHVIDLHTEQPGLEDILLAYYQPDPAA
jgi:ABC-2 type transport system ATP-binding protein